MKHLKSQYPELWAKTSLLTLGCYAGNWKLYKDGAGRPQKVKDGVYKVRLPMNEEKRLCLSWSLMRILVRGPFP